MARCRLTIKNMLSVHHLPNHLPGEQVELFLRRDVFILFKSVLMLLLLLLLSLGAFYLLIFSRPDFLHDQTIYALLMLGGSAYYLLLWTFFFFMFVDYYLDVWIVTNRRIIDIQQKGFFARVVAEQKLFRVQDVTSEVKGILPSIFKYGNVHIQTAGHVERFFFQEVPEPDKVRQMIISLVEKNKKDFSKEMIKEEVL